MLLNLLVTVIGGAAATLNLDGQATLTAVDPVGASKDLKVDNDGMIYHRSNGGSYIQLDDATGDWIRPIAEAPGTYQVRYTNLTGDALSSSTAAEDVWYALSSGDFTLTISSSTGLKTSNFDIEIRRGGSGAALVSASYSIAANQTI